MVILSAYQLQPWLPLDQPLLPDQPLPPLLQPPPPLLQPPPPLLHPPPPILMTLITLGCEDQPLLQPPLPAQGFELQPLLLRLLIHGLELQPPPPPWPPLLIQGLELQPLVRMMPAEQQAMSALSTINSFILSISLLSVLWVDRCVSAWDVPIGMI